MASNNSSFYDLLKEGYRKKKDVNAAHLKSEEMLRNVKTLAKNLTKGDFPEAIETITKIQDLEKWENLEEFELTKRDFDLISLIKGVILCCGDFWEEAEDLFYGLTEKYQECVFFALLGFTKNKRQIFKCSRDTLFLAKLASTKSFSFEIPITTLNEGELKDGINNMTMYTKEMKEIPFINCLNMNIIEINNSMKKSIGNIIRMDIFPLIRNQIDCILSVKPLENDFNDCQDQSTQTENMKVSKWTQIDVKTTNKAVQTNLKEKIDQKKDREIASLKMELTETKRSNTELTIRLNEANKKADTFKNKITNLQQEIKDLRENKENQEHFSKLLFQYAFSELYQLQQSLCEQSKDKYNKIEAVMFGLRHEMEAFGLKNDLDSTINTVTRLKEETKSLEKSIQQRNKHVKQLVKSNQIEQLLNMTFANYVIIEPPNILLDIIAKLATVCKNNRMNQIDLRRSQMDLRVNLLDLTNHSGLRSNQSDLRSNQSGLRPNQSDLRTNQSNLGENQSNLGENQSNLRPNQPNLRPNQSNLSPNQSDLRSNQSNLSPNQSNLSPNQSDSRSNLNQYTNWNVLNTQESPRRGPSTWEFPPLSKNRQLTPRQLRKLLLKEEYETFVAQIQSFLPNCSLLQIKESIRTIQNQKNITFKDVELHHVIEYLNSTLITDDNNIQSTSSNTNNFGNIQDDSDQNICPICLENFVNNQISMECSHLFHNECITEWLRTDNHCPVCRRTIHRN